MELIAGAPAYSIRILGLASCFGDRDINTWRCDDLRRTT